MSRAHDASQRLSKMGISVENLSQGQLDALHQGLRGIETPMDLTESTPEEAELQKDIVAVLSRELAKVKPDDRVAIDKALKTAVEKSISRSVDREYDFEDSRATNQSRQAQSRKMEKSTTDDFEIEKAQNLQKAQKVQKAIDKSVAKQPDKPSSPTLARRSLLAPDRTLTDVHPSTQTKEENPATSSPYGHTPQERNRSPLGAPVSVPSRFGQAMVARQKVRQGIIDNSNKSKSPVSSERYSANDYSFEDARATNQARQMAAEKARTQKQSTSSGNGAGSGTNRGGPGMGGSYGGGGDGFDPSGRFHKGGLIDDGDPSRTASAHPIIAQEGEFVLSKKMVTSLGVAAVTNLNELATSAPHQAARIRDALDNIAGGPPKNNKSLKDMLLDDRYHGGTPGENNDYYSSVRREFKLAYPGDGHGQPILADGGMIEDGDAHTNIEDYPVRAPEGAFVLSRRAVRIYGPDLLNRINAASLSGDKNLLKAVKKALSGMIEPIAA